MFWVPKVVSWAESPFFEKKVWESSGLKQEHDVRYYIITINVKRKKGVPHKKGGKR